MRQFLIFTAVLFAVTLAAATSLPQPFDGDQSLFVMGAEQWHSGDVYFRDFWDLKPPGIYLFYLAAGSLFGFDEIGIHLFELLWSLALAVVLTCTATRTYQSRLAKFTVPLMTVGVYYCIADTWHLTQIEWLVALPLFLSLWTICRSPVIPSNSAFLIAGICGGLIGLCKPMYGLLPAAFWWCSILLHPATEGHSRLAQAIKRGVAFALGVAIPLTAAALYFYDHGVLDVALRTMFEYPPQVLAQKTDGYGMLLQGLQWFALFAGPMAGLAFLGSFTVIRTSRNPYNTGLVVWLVLGLMLVFIQRMWWEYHYLLVLVPLALLALRTLDSAISLLHDLAEQRSEMNGLTNRVALLCGVVLLFSAYPTSLLYRVARLSTFGFAVSAEQRMAYQSFQHMEYEKARTETQFLHEPSARSGEIYVFGNPITYRFAGRRQAIPQQGWSIKVYLPDQWTEIQHELRSAEPVYVYVAANKHEQLRQRNSDVLTLLDQQYHIARDSEHGTWYELSRESDKEFKTANAIGVGELAESQSP